MAAQLDFKDLFAAINDKYARQQVWPSEVDRFNESVVDATLMGAVAKCIDFNIVVNGTTSNSLLPFMLVANTRSICEELIYISYLHTLDKNMSGHLVKALYVTQMKSSILAQTQFFAKNNPMQPTIARSLSVQSQELEIKAANRRLLQLWKGHGFSGQPSIRELAHEIGLVTTYEYIYHMSSNYVHFNPGHIARLGWGHHPEQPYTFSTRNFSAYYIKVGRFLGALLFLGYCYCCPERIGKELATTAVSRIRSSLKSLSRWPEIVTFEEWDQRVPVNPLIRALSVMARNECGGIAAQDILSELESLQQRRERRL